MKKKQWYEIDDINDFIKTLRNLVLESFFEDKEKNIFSDLFESRKNDLHKKLSLEEAISIVKPLAKKNLNSYKKDEYLISNKTFTEMIDGLNRRIVSNLLLDLTNSGLIESAFDGEKNDFIFWPKDKNQSK